MSFIVPMKSEIKSPVFVASELLIYDNEGDMIEACRKYQPINQESQKGFHKFTYDDRTVIQCRIDSISSNRKTPIVKVTTNKNNKELEKTLKELGYEKNGNEYQKGTKHNQSISVCQFDKHDAKTLNFTKFYNK